jgi:hypothetical protein
MKLKLNMVAAAVALATLAGGANAGLRLGNTDSSSLALVAFNINTNEWYARDTGFFLNTFLPDGTSLLAGDNAAGDTLNFVTPEAGLSISGGSNASFADNGFTDWYATQTAADVRWFVGAYDNNGLNATDLKRIVYTSANPAQLITNGVIDQASAQMNIFWGGLTSAGVSATGIGGTESFGAGGVGQSGLEQLALIGDAVNVFYGVRSTPTGSTLTPANYAAFGNSGGLATFSLGADGNLSYELASVSAVPLPAAGWMMGAGLFALGGVIRRRNAAANA